MPPEKRRDWLPGDGAEQTDSSIEAAQARLADNFGTAGHRSDEPTPGFDAAFEEWQQQYGSGGVEDYRRWRQEHGEPLSGDFLDWVACRR